MGPVQAKSTGGHCRGCTDVPLNLARALDPCGAAVLPAPAFGEGNASRPLPVAKDLGASDRHVTEHDARAPASSAPSFQESLFSGASLPRPKSSVVLLI